MEWGITSHAMHATAAFCELSIAVSALSLRILGNVEFAVGSVDDCTLSANNSNDLDGYLSARSRGWLERSAKITAILSIACLFLVGFLHFDCCEVAYFFVSLALCITALVITGKSERTRLESNTTAGSITIKAKAEAARPASRFKEELNGNGAAEPMEAD